MAGLTPRLRPLFAIKVLLALGLVAATFSLQSATPMRADTQCAFPFTPTTYEDLRNRQLFLNTIELAAFNMLFPGDEFFGLPDIEVGPRNSRSTLPGKVPPVLLKSIAYVESRIAMASGAVPFGAIGPALIAFDCGHGVTQVTTGMTVPTGEAGRGSPEQALVATHFAYNIARGAAILVEKWNEAPEQRPIAGRDTQGHPAMLENWYFAIWGYNGFTGPGANRSNHPMDPIYGSWPRTPYSCGPDSDGLGHNRNNYPYQELIIGCAANPPVIDGMKLWEAQPISLPNLNNATVRSALSLENFVFPYAKMDIPSPTPFHMDHTPKPPESLRDQVLGNPKMALSSPTLTMGYTAEVGSTTQIVHVFNTGTGVLAWYALPNVPWIEIRPYAGVAVGLDLPCEAGSPCERAGKMEVVILPDKVPPGATQGQILVQGLGTNESRIITVRVTSVMRLGAPGITRN